MSATGGVLQEVLVERLRQVEKGYDSHHDDQHSDAKMVHLAGMRIASGGNFRDGLIEAAAMLVAVVEKLDRRLSDFYDAGEGE